MASTLFGSKARQQELEAELLPDGRHEPFMPYEQICLALHEAQGTLLDQLAKGNLWDHHRIMARFMVVELEHMKRGYLA